MTMSAQWDQLRSSPLTLSAADSRVRMFPAQARARVLLAVARDCGISTLESSVKLSRAGASSKMSLAEQVDGLIPSCKDWQSLDMRRYRSRCQRSLSELRTCVDGSFSSPDELLPTATATATANQLSPSMAKSWGCRRLQELAGLLPTPSASSYGTQRGGAAGRVGKERPSLSTMARHGTLPTQTSNATGATRRPLNPRFVEWMMGFPYEWVAAIAPRS